MANSVETLQVYQRALEASREVSAILGRSSFDRDSRLREQMGSSSERVASLMSEGSEQSTDRHYAEYLYRARGSSREIRTQLLVARDRRHVSDAECERVSRLYEEIGKMLTGLIRYLEKENRKHRL